jgi:hypothetical protein
MTPKQKALIVEAFEQAADKAHDAMLHAQTALIDLKYDDPTTAGERATLIFQAAKEAQSAAALAGAWINSITHPIKEETNA